MHIPDYMKDNNWKSFQHWILHVQIIPALYFSDMHYFGGYKTLQRLYQDNENEKSAEFLQSFLQRSLSYFGQRKMGCARTLQYIGGKEQLFVDDGSSNQSIPVQQDGGTQVLRSSKKLHITHSLTV